MNRNLLLTVCLTVVIAAGTVALAQSQKPTSPAPDPRIDKVLEQNELILKNQAEILKKIDEANVALGALRRRVS